MTTEPTGNPQQPANPVAYELAFSQEPHGLSKLTSPLLDEDMHHGRAVDVGFDGDATSPEVLDPFQADSLLGYLTDQANIRRALEGALDRHHDEWHYSELPRGSAVWGVVRIEIVGLQQRHILTRETAGRSRKVFADAPDDFIERAIANSDTAETRWKFMVFLSGPWNDGHQRIVYFRDGALRSLAVEG